MEKVSRAFCDKESTLTNNDKMGENFTMKCMIMPFLLTIWSLRNYFDIVFTDYGVPSYDIGTGFGHFAISTPDVSVILHSRGIVDLTSVLVLRLNYAFLELLGLQIG